MKRSSRATTLLYRLISGGELAALRALQFRQFPPCTEAVFYPALSRHFALESRQYSQDTYLTCFRICAVYARGFEVQTICGEVHDELWVPAEELPVFNQNIIGRIRILPEEPLLHRRRSA